MTSHEEQKELIRMYTDWFIKLANIQDSHGVRVSIGGQLSAFAKEFLEACLPEESKKEDPWIPGTPLYDAFTSVGCKMTGQKSWDGVEMHLHIFDHLPEGDGCKMFSCDKHKQSGRALVGGFIERVFNASRSQTLENAKALINGEKV